MFPGIPDIDLRSDPQEERDRPNPSTGSDRTLSKILKYIVGFGLMLFLGYLFGSILIPILVIALYGLLGLGLHICDKNSSSKKNDN